MNFDDVIVYNGEYTKESTFNVSLKNRAFNYGDGLFETIRGNGKFIHFLPEHYERIKVGAEVLGYQLPELFTLTFLENLILGLLHRKRIYKGSRIKISIFRKEGGLYTPITNQVDFIIQASNLESEYYVLNEKGLVIDVFEGFQKPILPWSGFKSTNSLPFVLAGNYARQNNLNDVIINDVNGFISEAVSSNIFIYRNSEVLSPSLNHGCVDGILAAQLIKILQEHSIPFKYSSIRIEELETADEVFLSNSISGVQWVVGFRKRRYTSKLSKLLIRELNRKTAI